VLVNFKVLPNHIKGLTEHFEVPLSTSMGYILCVDSSCHITMGFLIHARHDWQREGKM